MPHTTPKSLSNNEVYALTAYILHLNDLIAEDVVLTRENLPTVEMPGRARSVDMSLGE
jgi:cytochrome c